DEEDGQGGGGGSGAGAGRDGGGNGAELAARVVGIAKVEDVQQPGRAARRAALASQFKAA
nr:hypothetical protein [Kofleriaceae bacterium]